MRKVRNLITDFFKRADMVLFALCCISTIFGLVVISSAVRPYTNPGPERYMIVQIGAFIIGIVLYVVFTVIDIDIIADKWIFLFAFSVLFMMTLFVWGQDDGTGNRAWLRFFGIGIQPSEVVKIAYIVLLAKHMSFLKSYRNLSSPLSITQIVLHFGFMLGLVLVTAKDLGSATVFLAIFVFMVFAAGVKLYWFAIGIAGIAASIPFLWNNVLETYQKDRIMAPYDPTIDIEGYGIKYQTNQSKLALASGRMTGVGLYNGTQTQAGAVPAQHSDFIYAVAGEELGMIACMAILILLTLIAIRCIYIGIKSRNTMNMLICVGMASMILFQTYENAGMCIGITPVVGITLPFFSYGGSSLFSLFAAMGIVSGIRFRPKPERFRSYG